MWDDKTVWLYSPRFLYIANLPQSPIAAASRQTQRTIRIAAETPPRQAPIGRLGRLCQNDNGLTCICIPHPIGNVHNLLSLATVCLIRLKVRLTFSMGESGTSFRGNIAFASRYIRFCKLFIKSLTSPCHYYAYMYSPSRTGEQGSFSGIVQWAHSVYASGALTMTGRMTMCRSNSLKRLILALCWGRNNLSLMCCQRREVWHLKMDAAI